MSRVSVKLTGQVIFHTGRVHANKIPYIATLKFPAMQKILSLSAFICVLSLGLACTKPGDNEKLKGENEPVGDFLPSKEGSYWLYGSNEGNVNRRVATGRDTSYNGRRYDYFENTDTNTHFVTPEYFGKNGEFYLMLLDLDGSQQNYLDLIVLKDDPQVGEEWTNTGSISYSGLRFDLKTEGEITATGGTEVINGVTYTEVITTKNILKGKPAATPGYINCGSVQMSFVKGIGVIRTTIDLDILSFYRRFYSDSLLNYHIEE